MSKAEKTKQFIVEKTAPVFNVKGFAGTTMRDITDATGLTKGSIYGNFINKDDVALAVFEHNLAKVFAIVRGEMDLYQTAAEKLAVYAHVYENFHKYPFPEGGCPILNTSVEADDTHPALRKKAADAVNAWKSQAEALVSEGIASGEFRAGTDSAQVALTIIAMVEGGVMITKVTGKLNYRAAVMKSVKKLIEDLK